MGARITKHGKLSPEKEEYIYFKCSHDDCGCEFKVKDNDKELISHDSKYGFIFKKRKIVYVYKCPECGRLAIAFRLPDEYDDI